MPNRAKAEIDQKSFLSFAFKGQNESVNRVKLTDSQQTVRDLTKMQGMTPKQIAKFTNITLGSVYDHLAKIREKGHML